jgi:hypothetical protein
MKKILAWVVAIFVGLIMAKLVFTILGVVIKFVFFSVFTLFFLLIVAAFALPVYVIAKKSFLKIR